MKMMTKQLLGAFGGIVLLAGLSAGQPARDCWAVSNMKGYSALSAEAYKFGPDGLSGSLIVCFTSDGGVVTGSDIEHVKFGLSTLAGFASNGKGNETFEVYQLDRDRKKLMYTKTRIGTSSMLPGAPDVVSAFVGDAVPVRQ